MRTERKRKRLQNGGEKEKEVTSSRFTRCWEAVDLLRSSTDNQSMRDYYFFIAIAYTRLKDYERALDYVEPIFKIEPNNKQAQELKAYIKKKLKNDGLIGMAVVGGAALALGGVVAATIAAIKK
ncbi:mitochondrial fission 1 protein [Elysia marginata]|uniref:Mitochondrial fission 1 protein n=1 Tax=Elysia marginata TaxID=1093978 RepID=A0AAV4FBI4_9GAST|nr:mitochondrial fission 1 protein [Elysia marginata]